MAQGDGMLRLELIFLHLASGGGSNGPGGGRPAGPRWVGRADGQERAAPPYRARGGPLPARSEGQGVGLPARPQGSRTCTDRIGVRGHRVQVLFNVLGREAEFELRADDLVAVAIMRQRRQAAYPIGVSAADRAPSVRSCHGCDIAVWGDPV